MSFTCSMVSPLQLKPYSKAFTDIQGKLCSCKYWSLPSKLNIDINVMAYICYIFLRQASIKSGVANLFPSVI
jgi:hypothetical protein